MDRQQVREGCVRSGLCIEMCDRVALSVLALRELSLRNSRRSFRPLPDVGRLRVKLSLNGLGKVKCVCFRIFQFVSISNYDNCTYLWCYYYYFEYLCQQLVVYDINFMLIANLKLPISQWQCRKASATESIAYWSRSTVVSVEPILVVKFTTRKQVFGWHIELLDCR